MPNGTCCALRFGETGGTTVAWEATVALGISEALLWRAVSRLGVAVGPGRIGGRHGVVRNTFGGGLGRKKGVFEGVGDRNSSLDGCFVLGSWNDARLVGRFVGSTC